MQTLILYYLNLKPTHGYEIQRFIEVNELDQWTKIQSGSIYYALSKLEKDGLIEHIDRTNTAAKSRKVYQITDAGRQELSNLIRETIASPIYDIGSNKYFMYPLFTSLEYPKLEKELNKHIKMLKEKRDYLTSWKNLKINEASLEVEVCAFNMMIEALDMQIKWHKAILKDYDKITERHELFDQLVQTFNFDKPQNINPRMHREKADDAH